MKAIVSEYRKMRRIRINEYLLTIHLLWLPFHLYYKRSDLCVYNEYTYFSWTLLFQSLPNLVHWIRTNRPTRSASRALILVLYRPFSCRNSYFILSDNYKLVTYHNVRLCTCPMSQCLTRTQQTIASHNGGEQYRPEELICSE